MRQCRLSVLEAVYRRVYEWFGEHADKFDDTGAELHPVTTATTVRHGDGRHLSSPTARSPRPRRSSAGFSVVDVEDLDAAIELVKTWPMLDLPGQLGGDQADGRRLQPHGAVSGRMPRPHTIPPRTVRARHPIASSRACSARSPRASSPR